MYSKIKKIIELIDFTTISESRKQELNKLTRFIQKKVNSQSPILLNFICTHNSRRSQFSQVWAQVAAEYYNIHSQCYSGGIEVTACNERTVASLERFGFKLSKEGENNPVYHISWGKGKELNLFSKLYDDPTNPPKSFAAIMTCSHADENCPFVAGCEERIPLRYEDPKKYDNTPLENVFYDYRSFEIATELFYIYSNIKKYE